MLDFHNWFVDGFWNVSGFLETVLWNIFPYLVVLLLVLMIVLCLVLLTGWFWVRLIDSINAFKTFKKIWNDHWLSKKECEAAFKIFWEKYR